PDPTSPRPTPGSTAPRVARRRRRQARQATSCSGNTMQTILLDGNSLTRDHVVAIARGGVRVELDAAQLARVQRAADFLADKVRCGEPIYGVTTGFGSNADKLLGAHRARDGLPGGDSQPRTDTLLDELQHNLIVTHAVCVGEPFGADVVR